MDSSNSEALAPGLIQDLPPILVVEDDPHFSELMGRILSERHGFPKVSFARSLSEALDSLRVQAFGLIFLDLNVPDSHGLVTLSSVLPLAQGAQVLVMTGEVDEGKALPGVWR